MHRPARLWGDFPTKRDIIWKPMLQLGTLRMATTNPQFVLSVGNRRYDLSTATDISLHVNPEHAPNAFHLPPASFVPFRAGTFVGSIEQGGPVRCEVVTVAPHGNGTHTECVGHIAGGGYNVTELMNDLVDEAELLTVVPSLIGEDAVVTASDIQQAWKNHDVTTLIIRTLPNDDAKREQMWSGNNPPYLHLDAMNLIVERGIRHLMVDVPSVDREEDQGALVAHQRFWQWPHDPRLACTITELIYVPNTLPDGRYLVMFNVAPFDGDAAPSRPVVVKMVTGY